MALIASSVTLGMLLHGIWTLLTRSFADPDTTH